MSCGGISKPEYWLTWLPVMERLADRYTLVAPDLRGFGDSDKPPGPWGNEDHAADLLALLDALQLDKVGVVGHDVGGGVMQPLARQAPERARFPHAAPASRVPSMTTTFALFRAAAKRSRRSWSGPSEYRRCSAST